MSEVASRTGWGPALDPPRVGTWIYRGVATTKIYLDKELVKEKGLFIDKMCSLNLFIHYLCATLTILNRTGKCEKNCYLKKIP